MPPLVRQALLSFRDWSLESGHASSYGADTPADWPIGCAIEKLRHSTATTTRGKLPRGTRRDECRINIIRTTSPSIYLVSPPPPLPSLLFFLRALVPFFFPASHGTYVVHTHKSGCFESSLRNVFREIES